MALLDVVLGYDCNLSCDYCTITPEMRRRNLRTPEVLAAMAEGRQLGYDEIAFTGGEPTIRPDLLGLVRAARASGFSDVKVQSNGLVYAQPKNVEAAIRAGVTRFHVSIHTHEPEAYDRLVRREGSHALMAAGLDQLVAHGVRPIADVILKEDTYRRLPAALTWLGEHGIRRVHLWYVSLTDGNRDNLASMPRITDVVPTIHAALAQASTDGIDLWVSDVPRCLLGAESSRAFDPGADRVRVVTPDSIFELRDSRLAGKVHVAACEGCEHRAVCPGVRPDYLERYGDEEIAAARGQSPSVQATRHLPVRT